MTRFPGVHRRPDSGIYQFGLRAPEDLRANFPSGWAIRASLKTADLKEANAKAKALQAEWATASPSGWHVPLGFSVCSSTWTACGLSGAAEQPANNSPKARKERFFMVVHQIVEKVRDDSAADGFVDLLNPLPSAASGTQFCHQSNA